MLLCAIKYRDVIDTVTVDKSLKLQKFELDNDDWKIIQDLVLRLSMDLYLQVWVTYPRVLAVAKVIPASLGKIDAGLPAQGVWYPHFWGLPPVTRCAPRRPSQVSHSRWWRRTWPLLTTNSV